MTRKGIHLKHNKINWYGYCLTDRYGNKHTVIVMRMDGPSYAQ